MASKHVLILLCFWGCIYLAGAFSPALLDDADTVHAEAAREMAQTGDWITLHANTIRYLEKAPLMYWLIAISYKLFGVNEFASRLPINLAVLALIFVTYFLGKFSFGAKAGFYSAIVLCCSAGLYLFTRVLWPDVLLTLWISLCVYSFLRATQDPKWAYGIYVFSALAVLTKGLIGIFFPASIIGIYLMVRGKLGMIRNLRPFRGALIFLAIAAPWHIAAGLKNRTFFWFYFMNEHFLRYIGKRYPMDYDTVPLLLFLFLHLVWIFPWPFYLPVVRKLFTIERGPQKEFILVMLIWISTIILFFCFSTRQEYYTMPTYPAFALLIGAALAEFEVEPKRLSLRYAQMGLLIFGCLVFAAGISIYFLTRNITLRGDISTALSRNPSEYALSLGHILDLTPTSLSALRVPIIGTALSFLAGSVAAFLFRKRKSGEKSVLSLAVMMVVFFYCAHLSLITFEPYLSSKKLARAIEQRYREGEIVVINGEYEGGSSLNFYLRRPVYILNGRSANLEYGSYFPDAPKLFLKDHDLLDLWRSYRRIYLFTDGSQQSRMKSVLSDPAYVIAESGGKLILSNRP